MELNQIRYFLALANTLNFTRAAEHCNVTQPALTKAVQRLEQEFGGPLIYRERRFTQMTDLGKAVFPFLEHALASMEAARLQALEQQRGGSALLRIGLSPSISARIVAETISEVGDAVPGLQIDMYEAATSHLIRMLLGGDIDAAIVGDIDHPPERVHRWRLFEEHYVVLSSRLHPLSVRSAIPIEALQDTAILQRIGCEVVPKLKRICLSSGVRLKFGHRSQHESHLQHMVATGLGVMLAPNHVPRLPSLAAIKIEGDPLTRDVQLLTVTGRRYSIALDAFIKRARLRDWVFGSSKTDRDLALHPVRLNAGQ